MLYSSSNSDNIYHADPIVLLLKYNQYCSFYKEIKSKMLVTRKVNIDNRKKGINLADKDIIQ